MKCVSVALGRGLIAVFAVALVGATPAVETTAQGTIPEMTAELAAGRVTATEILRLYIERIKRNDPLLHSVLALDPDAERVATARDAERKKGTVRGPLHGVPILVKDNIETAGALPTTAGSLALADNINDRDAVVVARLRAAGAVIVGKTNLSEWANIRSSFSVSGWSAVGGLTRNPHALDRSACGSSSGSGAAIAAGFAAAALGTETDGSITCPAAMNGIVGLKPTIGLVPRTLVIPISSSQDTVGPMTRTVTDAAVILGVIAGAHDSDVSTAIASKHVVDYVAGLDAQALRGARLGVMRFLAGRHPETDAAFERALVQLRDSGATLVDITEEPNMRELWAAEKVILETELKTGMNAYLASVTPKVSSRTLSDVIAFNVAHRDREMRYFGQDFFEAADAGAGASRYKSAVASAQRIARTRGLDPMLARHKLVALVAPTTSPAWLNDVVDGDHFLGSASELPAVAGYPHLTLPMGAVHGLPVGLSFIGPAWSDAKLLALGYAFEQRTKARVTPTFAERIEF